MHGIHASEQTSRSTGHNRFIHMDEVKPFGSNFLVGSWNVEGLSDVKLFELILIMKEYNIGILSIQETRVSQSPYYYTDEGFLVVLSGSSKVGKEWAGVGFIIAPWLAHAVVGFLQLSNRLCCLKLRVQGGTAAFISAYAPHSGYSFDQRQTFFEDLGNMFRRTSVNGLKMVLGDLNSRLHKRLAGESSFIGDFVFGNAQAHLEHNSNRDLLVEFCTSHDAVISNTFFDNPPERQVTYRSLGVQPLENVSSSCFAVIDFALTRRTQLHEMLNVWSERRATLASHHFLLLATVSPTCQQFQSFRASKTDASRLKETTVSKTFANAFQQALSNQRSEDHGNDVNWLSTRITSAFDSAKEAALPEPLVEKRRPWISQTTLDLIQRRHAARAVNDFAEEQRLHKLVRNSAKHDRAAWLNELAGANSWQALRRMRTKQNSKQGRLNNADGQPVSSELRADRFANFLETEQWRPRAACLDGYPVIYEELPVDLAVITMRELKAAIARFKLGRACGPDKHPVEFWRTIVADSHSEGARWLLELCNCVWSNKDVPESWHLQRVAMIFKKGDPALCENYRPICLLNAAYKIFAMILLRRLVEAGADSRIWQTQFGFKRGCGTEDALHCARRAIERAIADRGGRLHLLALDWAKAFDSIDPRALLDCLRRLGIPNEFCLVVAAIYKDRKFFVSDCGVQSSASTQSSGICQGCPLSPYLFSIVMTVLMHDAHSLVSAECRASVSSKTLSDILYADDTLIMGRNKQHVEELAVAVETVGVRFGMKLHWGKTQAISIGTAERLQTPDGQIIQENGSLKYLGGMLYDTGRIEAEISQKMGIAAADFRQLQALWKHSSVSAQRKVVYLQAFIISRLVYGLSTAWLVKAQRRRLDGFYARSLRRIFHVPAAFISRVSNAKVFELAKVRPLSDQLLDRQLLLLGKAARSSPGCPLRQDVFHENTLIPQIGFYVRRLGRPRQDWTNQLLREASNLFGHQHVESILRDESLLHSTLKASRSCFP